MPSNGSDFSNSVKCPWSDSCKTEFLLTAVSVLFLLRVIMVLTSAEIPIENKENNMKSAVNVPKQEAKNVFRKPMTFFYLANVAEKTQTNNRQWLVLVVNRLMGCPRHKRCLSRKRPPSHPCPKCPSRPCCPRCPRRGINH